jgi:DNA end-binding protein Ku
MPRVMWKGAISFGLVNIPIRMYTAVKEKSVQFHMLSSDGTCRLRRKLYCPETGKEYEFKDAARGYEVAPGQYVLIDKEELEQLRPDLGRNIEIEDFVSLEEIDPLRYERPYYLAPAEGGGRPYRLLVEAMERMGKVGIARFVLREKQHLAALRITQGGLCLSTMYWADEVLAFKDVSALPDDKVDEHQLELATNLISALTKPFDPSRYQDTYRQELMGLIERKAEGKRIPVHKEPEQGAQVVDLMDALKRSLDKAGGKRPSARSEQPSPAQTGKKAGGRKKASSHHVSH